MGVDKACWCVVVVAGMGAWDVYLRLVVCKSMVVHWVLGCDGELSDEMREGVESERV
jgi:hypothetical protein